LALKVAWALAISAVRPVPGHALSGQIGSPTPNFWKKAGFRLPGGNGTQPVEGCQSGAVHEKRKTLKARQSQSNRNPEIFLPRS
jgi:hypothetical protein